MDQDCVPGMAAVDAGHESTRQEDHEENDYDEQPDEGAGAEGAVLEESPSERTGHR